MSKIKINPDKKENIMCLRGEGKTFEFAEEMIKSAGEKVRNNIEKK